MQYGIFRYTYSENLGDEIQSIAASAFLPRVDCTIERDRLHWYKGTNQILVPFNGWFTNLPMRQSWPPPDNIIPILLSWYAVKPDYFINSDSFEFFKRHEPVGCRSLSTVQAFERNNIRAFHSGCLTLTLKGTTSGDRAGTYIVDADADLLKKSVPPAVIAAARFMSHQTPVGKLRSPTGFSVENFYLRILNRLDEGRDIVRHHREKLMRRRHSKRTSQANERLACYSSAKLVITSLLHCAMPCLALGTPVVLLRKDMGNNERLAGLEELVNYRSNGDDQIKINWDAPEIGEQRHLALAERLKSMMREKVIELGGSSTLSVK